MPVEENHVSLDNHPLPIFRQSRQLAIQVRGQRFKTFLQPRRQLAVFLQMFLQSGRKIAASLGQSRGETFRFALFAATIILLNDSALHGEKVLFAPCIPSLNRHIPQE